MIKSEYFIFGVLAVSIGFLGFMFGDCSGQKREQSRGKTPCYIAPHLASRGDLTSVTYLKPQGSPPMICGHMVGLVDNAIFRGDGEVPQGICFEMNERMCP